MRGIPETIVSRPSDAKGETSGVLAVSMPLEGVVETGLAKSSSGGDLNEDRDGSLFHEPLKKFVHGSAPNSWVAAKPELQA